MIIELKTILQRTSPTLLGDFAGAGLDLQPWSVLAGISSLSQTDAIT